MRRPSRSRLFRQAPALLALAVPVICALLNPLRAATTEPLQERLARAEQEIGALEARLADNDGQTPALLGEAITGSAWIRDFTNTCIAQADVRVAKISADLEELGVAAALDTPEMSRLRDGLGVELHAAAQNLGQCRILSLRRQDLVDEVVSQRQQILTRHLLGRGPNVIAVVATTLSDPWQLWQTTRDFVLRDSGVDDFTPEALGLTLLAVLLVAVPAVFSRRLLLRQAAKMTPDGTLSTGFVRAALACYGNQLPSLGICASGALGLTLTQGGGSLPAATLIVYGLGLYLLLLASIRLFLHPCPPAEPWLPVAAEITRPLARRLQVLALLLLIGFLFFGTLVTRSFPESIQLLVRDVYAAFLALNLIWVFWLAGRLSGIRQPKRIAFMLTLLVLGALASEWLGYANLSLFIARGLVITLLALGLVMLLTRTLRELFDSLDDGRYQWQQTMRRSMGIKDGNFIPGLSWLRFAVAITLWGGAAILLLRVWGLSDTGLEQLLGWVADGFDVGEIHVVPGRVVFAVLIMALLLAIAGWIKKQSADQWLNRTRMDRGAREASATIIGYSGVAVAILVALSLAGVEFTNLAIIAGALSVGIGFGLQNIVNNFVSGLILLFERPIRTGDWIAVGGTEGYVKQISIRSTQIQTFDRADVIVPNSELISGQVVNWMLNDPWGRLKLPVGVAYGSDTAKVKEILLAIAREHPLVLDEHAVVPPPTVLFLAFGASSLDFELRCFIRQVDSRLSVLSDLNFAVDQAFREAGVEIPFPQRDLHIKSALPQVQPPIDPAPAKDDGAR